MKSEIRSLLRAQQYSEALALICQVQVSDDLALVEYAAEALGKIPQEVRTARVPLTKRLALLGGATTSFLVPQLRLFSFKRGVDLEVYESDYGVYEQEVWTSSPALQAFKPDVIHFFVGTQNLALRGAPTQAQEAEIKRFVALYEAATSRFDCAVVANNFQTEVARPLGSLDATLPASRNSMIRAINAGIAQRLPARVFIHDVELLSATHGKLRFQDQRLWNTAKVAVSFDCQPYYADSLAAELSALFGKSRKCLVLDLDNTLWGGVIGDDGLSGIELGQGQPRGEAFAAFQSYVKALKERGVLLAVCSKNEHANAVSPFREHPGMVLKESDISCFVANWEPKHLNILQIAKRLNIGTDSLVFFDDNPAERHIVRTNLPEVFVVEVPEDPSLYVQALDAANLFDTLSITDEDRKRGDFFQSAAARETLERDAGSYEDYLRQLEMVAHVEPINTKNLVRVTQLINKTNQFNLTTRRMTEAEVEAVSRDSEAYTCTIRLEDRFGDNGLISVVIGSIKDSVLHIDTWLMSCRVLKRGVEALQASLIVDFCASRGLKEVRGLYLPTAKNKLVEKHYESLGFRQIDQVEQGTLWSYEVGPGESFSHAISVRKG